MYYYFDINFNKNELFVGKYLLVYETGQVNRINFVNSSSYKNNLNVLTFNSLMAILVVSVSTFNDSKTIELVAGIYVLIDRVYLEE